jgi:hypothetical protein
MAKLKVRPDQIRSLAQGDGIPLDKLVQSDTRIYLSTASLVRRCSTIVPRETCGVDEG